MDEKKNECKILIYIKSLTPTRGIFLFENTMTVEFKYKLLVKRKRNRVLIRTLISLKKMKCVLKVYEGYNHIFMLLVEHVEGSLDGLCMCMTHKPYNVPVFSYNYMPSLYIS